MCRVVPSRTHGLTVVSLVPDEVDIVGFDGSSSPSDTDDQSSIQSSDGGCSFNTRQLTLSDDSL